MGWRMRGTGFGFGLEGGEGGLRWVVGMMGVMAWWWCRWRDGNMVMMVL